MIDAPVILVADIDRGGVFASIYGTLALLAESERVRVKGVIINKFRGDVALLMPGVRQIEELTGVPVLGVMPYLQVDLEDEDGVVLQSGKYKQAKANDKEETRLISSLFSYRIFPILPISMRWQHNLMSGCVMSPGPELLGAPDPIYWFRAVKTRWVILLSQ